MKKYSSIFTFIKAQISAFIGGLIDYLVMILCTDFFGVHYTLSILISGSIGAIINFSINRKWTFNAEKENLEHQVPKFIITVIGSILLKSGGTYLVTNCFNINYKISRVITDLIVSLGFNYTLQKYWVFRGKKISN